MLCPSRRKRITPRHYIGFLTDDSMSGAAITNRPWRVVATRPLIGAQACERGVAVKLHLYRQMASRKSDWSCPHPMP